MDLDEAHQQALTTALNANHASCLPPSSLREAAKEVVFFVS
jgi:hypothetical protein